MDNKLLITEFDVPINAPHGVLLKHRLSRWNAVRSAGLIDEITKSLRYCDRVIVVLAERILPHLVVKELEWLNRQSCEIKMIVSNNDIAESYSRCCNQVVSDPKIDSSIIIIWKNDNTETYILGDTIYKAEQSEEIAELIEGNKSQLNTNFTSELFIGSNGVYYCDYSLSETKIWEELCESIAHSNLYIVGLKHSYNRDIYTYFKNKSYKLLITESKVPSGIWIEKGDKVYRLLTILGRHVILEAGVDDVRAFTSIDYYTPVYLEKNFVKYESNQVYWFSDERIEKSNIKDVMLIKKTIFADNIDDYILENYDKKFMSDYTSYQEYCLVRYEVTLIPPLLLKTDVVSTKYPDLVDYLKETEKYISKKILLLSEPYKLYLNAHTEGDYIVDWFSDVSKLVKHFIVQDGRSIQANLLARIEKLVEHSIDVEQKAEKSYRKSMSTIIMASYENKTTKFDKEIGEIRERINHLTNQINEENDFRIRRKIRDLDEELKTLENLKESLTPQTINSGKEDLEDVMIRYAAFVKSNYNGLDIQTQEDLSIGKVIANDEDKMVVAEKSFQKVVSVLVKCQKNITQLWEKILQLDLPKVGILYFNSVGNVLAVRKLEEVKHAKEEAKKYLADVKVDRIYSVQ